MTDRSAPALRSASQAARSTAILERNLHRGVNSLPTVSASFQSVDDLQQRLDDLGVQPTLS